MNKEEKEKHLCVLIDYCVENDIDPELLIDALDVLINNEIEIARQKDALNKLHDSKSLIEIASRLIRDAKTI